jgi:sulfite exporter TauE/SafE
MSTFVAGLLFGAVGSAHCAAMCGPLVVTIDRAFARPSLRARVSLAAAYHAARVGTYACLGVGAGAVGQALTDAGLGRALAVAAGVVLAAVAVGSVMPAGLWRASARPARLAARACAAAASAGRAHPVAGATLTGAANGLLPCGLVYTALLTATAVGTTGGAVMLMTGFGVGTLPTLLALTLAASTPAFGIRKWLRRLQPVLLAVTAVILLARGLAPASAHPPHSHAPGGQPVNREFGVRP